MKEIKIVLPTSVGYGKNKFILNLNNYRNLSHFPLNEAKKRYTLSVFSLTKPIEKQIKKCELEYTYYHGTKSKIDLMNVISVIDKFTCDALTKRGYWEDDNSNVIGKTTCNWGGYQKDRQRCELVIKIIE